MKSGILALFIVLVFRLHAISQVQSGTIVAVTSSENEIVVAADSRVYDDRTYADNRCKISTFNDKLIFSASGETGEGLLDGRPVWDVHTIARREFRRFSGKNAPRYSVLAFAEAWGKATKITVQDAINRKVLTASEDGAILSAMFAGFDEGGGIAIISIAITYQMTNAGMAANFIVRDIVTKAGNQQFIGKTQVVEAFMAGDPGLEREVEADSAKVSPGDDRVAFASVEMVKLTARHIPEIKIGGRLVKPVGGPIDAVKLSRSGGIQWISKKDNCPAN